MRNLYFGLGVASVLGGMMAVACGGDGRAGTIDGDKPSGGRAGSTGGGGKAGGSDSPAGSPGDDGGTDSGDAGAGGSLPAANPPVIQIITPTATATPVDGALTADTVAVTCKVEKASANAPTIDASTVQLILVDEDGKETKKEATATGEPDEYSAEFVLTTVPAGKITLTCSASDVQKKAGTGTISTFLDHGPIITVTTPVPNGAYPVKGGLAIEFEVAADPLADDDPASEVDTVEFKLDDREFEVEELEAGKFKATLMLDDVETFPQVPTGAIGITATNKRAPEPATTKMDYNILIDGSGPVITINFPTPQKVVGGKVTLDFNVTDVGSGVSPEAVNVTLYPGDQPRFYNPAQGWKHQDSKYTFIFDTKEIEPYNKVQTTINVRASDLVENQSASGQSVQIYLDNVPPKVDLDPRNIRTRRGGICSRSFDPVGNNSLNDLAGQFGTPQVTRIDWFRAFVDEQTNSIGGQTLFYYSGTDQNQVRLYVQADPGNASRKLLVNKNPETDNLCDDIGGIEDVVNAPTFSALKPLPKPGGGTVWNELDEGESPSIAGECTLQDGGEPQHMCPAFSSDLWYPTYNFGIDEPALYVVGTPVATDASCAGVDLEFIAANQPEGWVCVAARAVDMALNVGISPPLRICVDDPGTPTQPACRTSITTPPTCTDGCVAPDRGGNIIRLGP